jgi:O-antigen/teichoic acid export membrane protein
MLRGSSWAAALTWAMRGIGLVNTVILARLLAPEDFGLVAMASLAMGLLETFSNFGTGMLLIRQPVATREHCDTAWTIALLRGLLIAVVLVLSAPLIASYFREARVVPIIYVVAANSALNGALNIGLVLMRKELQFGREFRFLVSVRLFSFVATLALAFWLRSYWALVLGSVAGAVFNLWISYRFHPYRPRLDLSRAREYLAFSAAMLPLNIFFFLSARADSFVVGRIASTAALGIYNIAAELSTMLTSSLTTQIGRALYPSYARLAGDIAKLREAYLDSLSALVIVNVAFGLGLFTVSRDFVAVVLGSRWMDAVPLIEWLAIAGTLRAIVQNLTGNIYAVSGRERTAAVLMLVRLVIIGGGAIAGGQLAGVYGVAVGVTIGAASMVVVGALALVRLLGLRLLDLLWLAWRPALAGAGMVCAVRLGHATSIANPLVTLALDIVLGAAVYLVLLAGLWWIAGRPRGVERLVFETVAARARGAGRA